MRDTEATMSGTAKAPEPPYHLLLDAEEVPVAAGALRLLISDEAARAPDPALGAGGSPGLEAAPDATGKLTVSLAPQQMKITHTAVRLLFDDLQRGQASEREILRGILDKLPDEHTMRAIVLR